jgi:hypothetical protein
VSPSTVEKLLDAIFSNEAPEDRTPETEANARRWIALMETAVIQMFTDAGESVEANEIDTILLDIASSYATGSLKPEHQALFDVVDTLIDPPSSTEEATSTTPVTGQEAPQGPMTFEDFRAAGGGTGKEEKFQTLETQLQRWAYDPANGLDERLAAWVDDNKGKLIAEDFQLSGVPDLQTWMEDAITPDKIGHRQSIELSDFFSTQANNAQDAIAAAVKAGNTPRLARLFAQQEDALRKASQALFNSPLANIPVGQSAPRDRPTYAQNPEIAMRQATLAESLRQVQFNADVHANQQLSIRTGGVADFEPGAAPPSVEPREVDIEDAIVRMLREGIDLPQDPMDQQEFIAEVQRRAADFIENFKKRALVGAAPTVGKALEEFMATLPSVDVFGQQLALKRERSKTGSIEDAIADRLAKGIALPPDSKDHQGFIDEVQRRAISFIGDFEKKQLVGRAPTVAAALREFMDTLPSAEVFGQQRETERARSKAGFTDVDNIRQHAGGIPFGSLPVMAANATQEQIAALAGSRGVSRIGTTLGDEALATSRTRRLTAGLSDNIIPFLENLAAGAPDVFDLEGADLSPKSLLSAFMRDPKRQAEKRSLQKAAFTAATEAGTPGATQAALGFGVEQAFNQQDFEKFAQSKFDEQRQRFDELTSIAEGAMKTPKRRARTIFTRSQ